LIKIITIPIKIFSYIFLILLPLAILNIFYPVFKLLSNKSKRFFVENITPEHEKEIEKGIVNFANKFKIEDEEEKQKFYKAIKKLSKFETSYSYIVKDNQYCYFTIRYILHIIELAKDGITSLENTNKEDSVSYYEEGRNSTLDKLLEEFKKELNEKSKKKKKYLKISINETKLKRLLIRMKKPNSRLFFNFYLTIFSLYKLEDLKIKNKDEDYFELAKSMLEFLSLGYATPGQIYKSVAIQIYYLYKEKDIGTSELQDIIGDLISMSFQTKTPYENFNNIDQEPYIKNLVGKFPVFSCNNDKSFKQHNKVKKIFIYKSPYLPPIFPLFLKKIIVNKIITKPIDYYRKNALIIFFGLFSAKN